MSSLSEVLEQATQQQADEVTMETGQPAVLATPQGSVPIGAPIGSDALFDLLRGVLSDEQQVELMVGNVVEFKMEASGTGWSLVAEPGADGVVIRGRRSGAGPSRSAGPSLELPAVSPFDAGNVDDTIPPGAGLSFDTGIPSFDSEPAMEPSMPPPSAEVTGGGDPFGAPPMDPPVASSGDDPFDDPFGADSPPPPPQSPLGAPTGDPVTGDGDIPALEDTVFSDPVTEPLDDDDSGDDGADFAMVPPTSTSRVTYSDSQPAARQDKETAELGPVTDDDDDLPPLVDTDSTPRPSSGSARGPDSATPPEMPAFEAAGGGEGAGRPGSASDLDDPNNRPTVGLALDAPPAFAGQRRTGTMVAALPPVELSVDWSAQLDAVAGEAVVEAIPEASVTLLRGASGLELVDEFDPLCHIEGDDPASSGESARGREAGSWIVLAVDDPAVWLPWILRRLEEGHRLVIETGARSADGARRVLLGVAPGPRAEAWLKQFPLYFAERGEAGFALHRAVGHG